MFLIHLQKSKTKQPLMVHPVCQWFVSLPELLTVWVFTGGKAEELGEVHSDVAPRHRQVSKNQTSRGKKSPVVVRVSDSFPLGATRCLASCQLNLITPQHIAKSLPMCWNRFIVAQIVPAFEKHLSIHRLCCYDFRSGSSVEAPMLFMLEKACLWLLLDCTFCRDFCSCVNVSILSRRMLKFCRQSNTFQAPTLETCRLLDGCLFLGIISRSGESIMYLAMPPYFSQIGSYFGSEIAPVDIDGDGITDNLLVAAPMFFSGGLEKGKVYIYRVTELVSRSKNKTHAEKQHANQLWDPNNVAT